MQEDLKERYLRCRPVAPLDELDGPRLEADLDRYTGLARDLGASDASAIEKDDWYLDPRVTLKCGIPRCRNYNTCANCPPHSLEAEKTASLLEHYRWGILLRWTYKPETSRAAGTAYRRVVYETIAAIEAAAFYDGYYFACGFGSGSCRRSLCGDGICQELAEPLKGCRYPLLARPSMEAVGFDVYRTAFRAGWIMHPAGSHCPEAITTLSRIAIVLIT